MPGKFPKFGELNSAEHSQDPESLEPDNLDGMDLIAINNSKTTKPNVIKKLIGPLKGVVLKGVGDINEVQTGGSLFDFLSGKSLKKYRIRIPEIHAHLPEPEDFNNVPQSLACLYPEFISESTDTPEVQPGTLVWCNFLDRENMQEPVYLGPVDKQATSTTESANTNKMAGLLGLGAGGDNNSTNQQIPGMIPVNVGEECTNPLNFSNCNSLAALPGEYETYISGKPAGKVAMVTWTNINGSKRLVRSDIQPILELMRNDMKKNIGEDLIINSSFRGYEQQKCMYAVYVKCVEKWKNNGSRGLKPSAVANPEKAGPNSHLTGRAFDLDTGGVSRDSIYGLSLQEIKTKISLGQYSKKWRWLINNSEKYGFVWVGVNFLEPWHFQFDEKLAPKIN